MDRQRVIEQIGIVGFGGNRSVLCLQTHNFRGSDTILFFPSMRIGEDTVRRETSRKRAVCSIGHRYNTNTPCQVKDSRLSISLEVHRRTLPATVMVFYCPSILGLPLGSEFPIRVAIYEN
jgi:hypothetical protein